MTYHVPFSKIDGGGLAMIHQNWLKSRKSEVFWPPYKNETNYNRALKRGEEAGQDWVKYKLTNIFYSSVNLFILIKILLCCSFNF